jgi:Domain of unknown function (DUF4111)
MEHRAAAWLKSQCPEEVEHLVADITEGVQRVLDRQLLGLYIYGSLVTGDFDRVLSDVDLVAVLDQFLDDVALGNLVALHRRIVARHPAWNDRVEVAYLTRRALSTFRTERSPIAVISPGEPLHIRAEGAGRDWVTNWYVVHNFGIPLIGPDPRAFISLINFSEVLTQLRRKMKSSADEMVQDTHPGALAYRILTACRCLYAARRHELVPKRMAAGWAREELPYWADHIDLAVSVRATGGHSGWIDRERTRLFLRAVAERMAGQPSPDDNDHR